MVMFKCLHPLPLQGIYMHVHKQRKEISDRLARIEGHVHGVKNMVETDKTCPEILLQITAIRAALNKVSQIIIEDHIESCLKEAATSGKTEPNFEKLKETLSKII
jgi:DNA-binding FrmR family transcriptional regulator